MNGPPPSPAWLRVGAGSITLQVTARPGSSRRGIVGAGPHRLAVALHARALEGRANAELIEVIAAAFSVPRSAIAIEQGARGRAKLLRIQSPHPGALAAKIRGLARAADFKENRN